MKRQILLYVAVVAASTEAAGPLPFAQLTRAANGLRDHRALTKLNLRVWAVLGGGGGQ